MNSEVGFGRRVLEVLENEEISFEHLPSGIDTMSVILNTHAIENRKDDLVNKLCRRVKPDSITINDDLALIAVVGRRMVSAKGVAAKLLNAIAEADVNVRMIDQGSSELNIIIAVESSDFEKAMQAIYSGFVK